MEAIVVPYNREITISLTNQRKVEKFDGPPLIMFITQITILEAHLEICEC